MKPLTIRGRFYSVWQAAKIIHCTPQTIRNYIRDKTIAKSTKVPITSSKFIYLISATEVEALSR